MRAFLSATAVAAISLFLCPIASATQADDTTITIDSQMPGITPFISQLTLTASDTTVLKSIQFTVTPNPGSVSRPLSGTYSRDYMISRGYLIPPSDQIVLPVYGLYDNFTNTVVLTYHFLDGSSKEDSTSITTADFVDTECSFDNPNVLQPRTDTDVADLSYDYVMVRGACGDYSPIVIDSDGALRWVNPFGTSTALLASSGFFDNAVYLTRGTSLFRVELDGTVTTVTDYASTNPDLQIKNFHHNIDPGKTGMLLEADTNSQFESFVMEVDLEGKVIKTWDMAKIISDAMSAGGDDPSQFVYPTPTDWFHNNAATYDRADDLLIVSSRENFVIALDYETSAIVWILGDTTKKWHEFPSLAKFALSLAPGSLPPIGQHAVSITYDEGLLLFDNGYFSLFQTPPGESRTYSSPRKYQIDLESRVATEVWNFENDQQVTSPICSSVYEDAPLNYLVGYAIVGGLTAPNPAARLIGLGQKGTVFRYEYPTIACDTAYNSGPVHLENTKFPAVGPKALNLSTRGSISGGENALIAGFIVTGTDPKQIALRVLGPSLSSAGLSNTLSDPTLTLYDSSRSVIVSNDDWASDSGATELSANGLAPTDSHEAATVQTLNPGAYTVIANGKDGAAGLSLVEVYDLSGEASSKMANISTRGNVGTGSDVLITGFIVGDISNATLAIRALGPSLGAANVSAPLADPTLTVYDAYGAAIAGNDNWQDDLNSADLTAFGLAPSSSAEAATILHPPAGAYSVIVSGVGGGSGVSLLEVYDLD